MYKTIVIVVLVLGIACNVKRDPTNNTCPDCRLSDQVIPIVYGYPAEETFASADSGKVMLGGCEVTENDPNWYCKRDNTKF
jgi:hypothetical protein